MYLAAVYYSIQLDETSWMKGKKRKPHRLASQRFFVRIRFHTHFVWCKLLIFWWFQLDKLMTSVEFIEKSCAPNELNAGYGSPLIPGVCNATTGVFMDVCCRCWNCCFLFEKRINEIEKLICKNNRREKNETIRERIKTISRIYAQETSTAKLKN